MAYVTRLNWMEEVADDSHVAATVYKPLRFNFYRHPGSRPAGDHSGLACQDCGGQKDRQTSVWCLVVHSASYIQRV